jgi:hypothetical protein
MNLNCPYCARPAAGPAMRFECACWYAWRVTPGGQLTRYLPPTGPLSGTAPTPMMIQAPWHKPFECLPLASPAEAAAADAAPRG